MTTRPSSSPRGSDARPVALVDRTGRMIQLGGLIGKGGEGSVYAVEDEPELAAKVYHRLPLSAETVEKLEAMVACRSDSLDRISAWPHAVLYTCNPRQPCGILIPRIADARQLHELYGTANRRRHFSQAYWSHMILAARNVAAAFDSMHTSGIVVGDVNQGNLLVDQQMCVRFIDCDSFQIITPHKRFLCQVGTPHFTPGELQSKNLRETPRTPDHDRFGMAILLFHLLFVGRHPFAGRFLGQGELTIEKAIAQRRFAFSPNRADTLVEPPPFSLVLDDFPEPIGELFEWAFRGRAGTKGRPTAQQWVEQLDTLLRQRKPCTSDRSHVYFNELEECPWCRIEDEGGPEFFVSSGSTSDIFRRLERLEDRLERLETPTFPSLSRRQLAVPQPLAPTNAINWKKMALPDAATALLAVSAAACLLGVLSIWPLAAATVGALAGGALLLAGKSARARRDRLAQFHQQLQQHQVHLQRRAETVIAGHRQRQSRFADSLTELQGLQAQYEAADTKLPDVLTLDRILEKDHHLSSHLIHEHVARINGMSAPSAAVLQSYGIESALDVDDVKLMGIPNLTASLTMELMNWREAIEREYVFRPEHGVTADDVRTAGHAALKRFKIHQAQRILLHSRQLESVAHVAQDHLDREVKQFYEAATPARDLVKELREYQSDRSFLERLINRSPSVILAVALGAPALGWLLWLLFG